MRRSVTFAALLAMMVMSAPAAFAQTPGHMPSTGVRRAVIAVRQFTLQPALHEDAVAAQTVGTVTSAAQVHIPSSAFPSAFVSGADQAISANDAQNNTLQSAVPVHSLTYLQLGMLGGWYQVYGQSLVDNSLFVLSDLVSYYSSSDAATASFNNANNGWLNQSPITCHLGQGCFQITLPGTSTYQGNAYTAVLRVIQQGNTIFEGVYLLTQADFPTQKATADADLDTLSHAYLSLPTFGGSQPVPPPNPTPQPVKTPPPTPVVTPTPQPTPAVVDYRAQQGEWPKGTTIVQAAIPASGASIVNAFHNTPLAQQGRIDGLGFAEAAAIPLVTKHKKKCGSKTCSKKHKFSLQLTYVVDVFGTSAQAAGAFNEAKQYVGTQDVSSALGTQIGDQMYTSAGAIKKDNLQYGVLFFQRGKVLVEMTVFAPYNESKARTVGIIVLANLAQWLDTQAKTQG